ncbi:MAG: sugar phosphate isomerase/epimerase [Desulfobacterales bacterium]|nr:sugar phosphate isomerase/epimerase [Desulfobacterales bacterium]
MKKIACSTLPFRELSLTDALQKMADLGIAQVELCVDPHHSDPSCWNYSPEKILQIISHLGIQIRSIHVPVINITDNIGFESLQSQATTTSLKTIDLAACLGAEFIVQHIYYDTLSHNHSAAANSGNIILDINKVSAYAAEKRVALALENLPVRSNSRIGAGLIEVMAIVQGYLDQRVGICLDVTHCVASGMDPLDVLDHLDINRIVSIHASDNHFNSFNDQHLPIGKGEINWKEFFKRLAQHGFNGALVIEVSGSSKGGNSLIESIEFLRKIEIIQDVYLTQQKGGEK